MLALGGVAVKVPSAARLWVAVGVRPIVAFGARRSSVAQDEEIAPGGEMALEVRIDRAVCMGSGNCLFWATNVFDLDAQGVSIVRDIDGDPEDKILLARQGCPTQAISVFRDGELVP